MSLAAAMIGSQLLQSAPQMAIGAGQLLFNQKPEMFDYDIPDEVFTMLNMAKRRAGSDQFTPKASEEAEIEASRAGAMRTIGDMTGGSGASLGAISDLLAKELSERNRLADREYMAKRDADKDLMGVLGTVADFRDQEFELNDKYAFELKMNQYLQNRNAGFANLAGGFSGAGAGMSDFFMQQEMLKMMNE